MAFLFPSFLWALTALAIPVFIHLFQLRRFKRIEFSDVRFLKEVSQQTRSRKKVRHWLVLLARLLALACLVMAFAQPYMPKPGSAVKSGERAISLFLDDSWSMDGTNEQGRLLDQARKHAQDAVMAYKPTDRFQVITNTFEGRQQMLLGRDEALESAGQADVGPFSRPLSQVIERQRAALSQSGAPSKRAFLFTDLQVGQCDVEQWTNDTTFPTVIVPLPPANANNLSIDSVWFATPVRRVGQNEALHVRIRNYSDESLENVPLELSVDGKRRALATFGVEAQASVDTVLHFNNDIAGPHYARISLKDEPVVFDDDFHIAYRTAGKLNVLLVSGGNASTDASIASVFSGDSAYAFTQRPYLQFDLGALTKNDLVILNALPEVPSGFAGALRDHVHNGGSLAVFPATGADQVGLSQFYNSFGVQTGARDTTGTKVERIDLQHPFYREVFSSMPRNVDLPIVRERRTLKAPPTADILLRLQSGSPFLCAVPAEKGTAYVCASPLGEAGGTFDRHALFVTSLLRMAELSRPMGALFHSIGSEVLIPVENVEINGETAPHLRGPDGIDLVPEVRRALGSTAIMLHDEHLKPGPYALTLNDDTLALLALDLSRTESDLSAISPSALKERLAQRGLSSFTVLDALNDEVGISLKELDQGTRLWKWFIILAILFVLLEIILIRTSK